MNSIGTQTFHDWQLVLQTSWGSGFLVLAAAVALLAVIFTSWGYLRQTNSGIRRLLIFLRLLAAGVLFLLVCQPALQLRNVTRVPNHLVILADLSQSMNVVERPGETTRAARLSALLQKSASRLDKWRENHTLHFFGFGSSLRSLGEQWPTSDRERASTDQSTNMQDALAEIRRQYSGESLAGVVLLSDGLDNTNFGTLGSMTATAQRFLQQYNAPVHAVWTGSKNVRDLTVLKVSVDDFAFVRSVTKLEAQIAVYGQTSEMRLPVQLRREGKVVAQKELTIKPEQEIYPLTFEFAPPKVGKYVYSVEIPPQPDEPVTINNQLAFMLNVIRDRIRVLHVSGQPSWDEMFLRQLLKSDPNIDLISFFILRSPTDTVMAQNSEMSLIPFPTEELFEKELGSFDLILWQNFNYQPYGLGIYLPHLKRFVENGGGLAMIGGELSFSSGKYANTPLAKVLPVRLRPENLAVSALLNEEEFRPKITAAGKEHQLLLVAETQERSQQLWNNSPLLEGVNIVAGPATNATTLLVHPTLRDLNNEPLPVLSTVSAGKGRSLALMTDSSWYWAFPALAKGGSRQMYDRFWHNVIRWLIQDPELNYLRVIPLPEQPILGATTRILLRAYQVDYSPARDIAVEYEVNGPTKESSLKGTINTDELGEARVDFAPQQLGAYRLRARAQIGDRQNEEEALMLVQPAGTEERDIKATPATLQRLAAITGGEFLERPATLPSLNFKPSAQVHVNWQREIELWSHWWSLLIVVFFLALDWLLRRRFGYF